MCLHHINSKSSINQKKTGFITAFKTGYTLDRSSKCYHTHTTFSGKHQQIQRRAARALRSTHLWAFLCATFPQCIGWSHTMAARHRRSGWVGPCREPWYVSWLKARRVWKWAARWPALFLFEGLSIDAQTSQLCSIIEGVQYSSSCNQN